MECNRSDPAAALMTAFRTFEHRTGTGSGSSEARSRSGGIVGNLSEVAVATDFNKRSARRGFAVGCRNGPLTFYVVCRLPSPALFA